MWGNRYRYDTDNINILVIGVDARDRIIQSVRGCTYAGEYKQQGSQREMYQCKP